jgi:hypothetical protein
MFGIGDQDHRAGVAQHVQGFINAQPGIERDLDESPLVAGNFDFDDFDPVPGLDRDSIALLRAGSCKGANESKNSRLKLREAEP